MMRLSCTLRVSCPIHINYLAYGENHGIIHAEHDALQNLPRRPRNKRIRTAYAVVVRTSRTGELGESKPCAHCVNRLKNHALRLGYSVSHVYYSTRDQSMECVKIDELENTHTSSYYRFLKRTTAHCI
jgi:cytidine deaminase